MTYDNLVEIIIGLIITILVLISIIRDKRKEPETWEDKYRNDDLK